MGQIEVAGKNAAAAVDRLICSDASALSIGQAKYSGLLTPDGTFVDDVLVYRMAPFHFLFVANASNVKKDFAWITEQIKDRGRRRGGRQQHALRSARAAGAGLARGSATAHRCGPERDPAYWFANGEVANARATISRTGYSGEDGFEIFVPPNMADKVWQALLESGRSADVIPCGLGARDTLRLEAAMRPDGNDIDESTSVLEAGLDGRSPGRRRSSSDAIVWLSSGRRV